MRNERTKLLATALNNIAVATFVTALVAPTVSHLYGFSHPAGGARVILIGIAWFSASVAIHLGAQIVLRGLKP